MDAVISSVILVATRLAEKALAAKQLKDDSHGLGRRLTTLAECLNITQTCLSESDDKHYDSRLLGGHLQVCTQHTRAR
jgi:hypothetical protein